MTNAKLREANRPCNGVLEAWFLIGLKFRILFHEFVDQFSSVMHCHYALGVLFFHADPECLLKTHHNLNSVERVSTKFGKLGMSSNLDFICEDQLFLHYFTDHVDRLLFSRARNTEAHWGWLQSY